MKKALLFPVIIFFGLAMFSVSPSVAGETAGEYIDDSTMTTKINAIIVKDPDAHYFKIDVTTTQGEVVLQGFVNNRETEERLIAKIKEIKGVKSVRSLLKMEDKK